MNIGAKVCKHCARAQPISTEAKVAIGAVVAITAAVIVAFIMSINATNERRDALIEQFTNCARMKGDTHVTEKDLKYQIDKMSSTTGMSWDQSYSLAVTVMGCKPPD